MSRRDARQRLARATASTKQTLAGAPLPSKGWQSPLPPPTLTPAKPIAVTTTDATAGSLSSAVRSCARGRPKLWACAGVGARSASVGECRVCENDREGVGLAKT